MKLIVLKAHLKSHFFLFALVYFVQGATLAYLGNFQKPYLLSSGVAPSTIGVFTSWLLLPFIMKIFMGYISDKYNLFGWGHRKPYMVIGVLISSVCFFMASFSPPSQDFLTYAIFVFCGVGGVALFDTTTDGLAVDMVAETESGFVQSLMIAGKSLGYIIMSFFFGWLSQHESVESVFYVISLLIFLSLFLVWNLREPEKVSAETDIKLMSVFKSFDARLLTFSAFAIVYSVSSFGIDGLVTLFMSQELQASSTVIGQYGSLRGLGALMGAGVAGWSIYRFGLRQLAFFSLIFLALVGASIGSMKDLSFVLKMGVIWGMVWAIQETLFAAIAMNLVKLRAAATLFSIMMMFSNIGTSIGERLATSLVETTPYKYIFIILAGIAILSMPLLLLLFKIWKPDDKSSSSTY